MKTVLPPKLAHITLALALLSCGCGAGFRHGDPWNPNETRLFDDGIDLVEDISKLSGEWGYKAEQELDARSNLADMIALVNILSVQTNQDLDGVESKKIETVVEKFIYGTAPSKSLALNSSKDSLGYSLIIRHEQHLVGRHIVFVRWFEDEDGKLGHHFHISPASEALSGAVQRFVDARVEEEQKQE